MPKPDKCSCLCQEEFATNANLQRYKRRQSTALLCEVCYAQIKNKATLKDHLDKHTGVKKNTSVPVEKIEISNLQMFHVQM